METVTTETGVSYPVAYEDILTTQSVEFIADMVRTYRDSLRGLVYDRQTRQRHIDEGMPLTYPPETAHIRDSTWLIAPIPVDIQDRRVEITGPPERKMVINAMNSGANVYMADFEDSLSPTWENLMEGQRNLRDAVRGTITYQHPTKGLYALNDNPAVIFVRPRGLHLTESHFIVDDIPVPAAMFDFGMYMWHNARYLVDNDRAPYFYLPKLESYREARWWNDVITWTQIKLNIPVGTCRATVLIETLPAALQMEEILYELRDHSAGLNCGRWDYIFSYIKTLKNTLGPMPNRDQVNMSTPFLNAYSNRLIHVCHKRGAHAMGGMAAQIPIKENPVLNYQACLKVRGDKEREARAGHDGTWVAHPDLVQVAKSVFDEHMPFYNQISLGGGYNVPPSDLLSPPEGTITMQGLEQNVDVAVRYLAAWLSGSGCVPLYNLMEDTATAEISRAQVWHWLKTSARMECGNYVNEDLINDLLNKMVSSAESNKSKIALTDAIDLFGKLCFADEMIDFLTLSAYERIV